MEKLQLIELQLFLTFSPLHFTASNVFWENTNASIDMTPYLTILTTLLKYTQKKHNKHILKTLKY